MNGGAKYSTTRRLEAGTQLLLAAAVDHAPFDMRRIQSGFDELHITSDDALSVCIPDAARALGQDWLQDQLSFASVSTASARLFGLCKEMSRDWRARHVSRSKSSLLLATIAREDHLIGPAVLAEKLRRDGHSVQLLLNAEAETILTELRRIGHDAVLISCGSLRTLDLACKAIKTIKSVGLGLPILLGGAVVGLESEIEAKTGADLVTNDIDTALDTLAKLQLGRLGVG